MALALPRIEISGTGAILSNNLSAAVIGKGVVILTHVQESEIVQGYSHFMVHRTMHTFQDFERAFQQGFCFFVSALLTKNDCQISNGLHEFRGMWAKVTFLDYQCPTEQRFGFFILHLVPKDNAQIRKDRSGSWALWILAQLASNYGAKLCLCIIITFYIHIHAAKILVNRCQLQSILADRSLKDAPSTEQILFRFIIPTQIHIEPGCEILWNLQFRRIW